MQNISLICVGKMKEKELIALQDEYLKRLGRFCRCELINIEERKLPQNPSDAEIKASLEKEGESIMQHIPRTAHVIALCVEGKGMSSETFSEIISSLSMTTDKLCFIIGGSYGLSDTVKKRADKRISFSQMTFPHHLFRIMLLEQIYRSYTIQTGTAYHK